MWKRTGVNLVFHICDIFNVSFPRLYQIYIQRTNISFGLLHLYRLGEAGWLQVLAKQIENTPGTRVGSGFRDRMLAVKAEKCMKIFGIPYSYVKICAPKKISFLGITKVGEKQGAKTNKQERKREKSVKTMASYAYIHHHGWHTQATWTKIL